MRNENFPFSSVGPLHTVIWFKKGPKMRLSRACLGTALLMIFCVSPAVAHEVVGAWTGAIDNHLLVLVKFEKSAYDAYVGDFTDHEQPLEKVDANALKNTKLASVGVDGDHLSFVVPALGGARFDGHWNAETNRWAGSFQWGPGGTPSTLSLRPTQAKTLEDTLKPRAYASLGKEASEMEALIQGYAKDGRFMGTIRVSQDGRTVIDKGYGLSDTSSKTPNRPETRYHIASITKSLTATAIFMLQDRGQLSIDDPISRYIPSAPAAWDGITLRHLLAHTSGIADYLPAIWQHHSETFTPEQLAEIVRQLPTEFKPGERYQYSNSGYILLGAVIEKVSGKSYGAFMRENIFAPLHMDATEYNPEADRSRHPHPPTNHASGYLVGDDGPVIADYWSLSAGFSAGGVISTSADLYKWQRALFDGRLISTKSLTEMESHSLGLARYTTDGQILFGHAGNVPGYVSQITYQPDKKLSVIVLGNLNNSAPVWISSALTSLANGFPSEVVPAPKVIDLPPEILARYAGTYELMPDVDLTVTPAGKHLSVQVTGQDKVSFFPETETLFHANVVEAKLEFVRDKDGKFGCILHQGGQDITGRRKEP